MLREFRDFISEGDVLGLATAVILGAAFGLVVSSLVNDIIMPPIGYLLGRVSFNDLFIALDGGSYKSLAIAKAAGVAVIAYGNFINTLINFIIVAFVIFLVIRYYNRMRGVKVVTKSEIEKPEVALGGGGEAGADSAASASDAAAGSTPS